MPLEELCGVRAPRRLARLLALFIVDEPTALSSLLARLRAGATNNGAFAQCVLTTFNAELTQRELEEVSKRGIVCFFLLVVIDFF